jgi:hypothetical protein
MLSVLFTGHLYPQAGPYLGILRPWAQENFAPQHTSSYSVMCKQKQYQKTKHYSFFSIDLP